MRAHTLYRGDLSWFNQVLVKFPTGFFVGTYFSSRVPISQDSCLEVEVHGSRCRRFHAEPQNKLTLGYTEIPTYPDRRSSI